jgi:hypothetical protein
MQSSIPILAENDFIPPRKMRGGHWGAHKEHNVEIYNFLSNLDKSVVLCYTIKVRE